MRRSRTPRCPTSSFWPSGPNPPNPAELLLTEKFRAVMEELEANFDRIIFDSPPLLAVTDAVVLARNADGVILVVRAGETTLDDATQAARQLRDVDAEILGTSFSTTPMSAIGATATISTMRTRTPTTGMPSNPRSHGVIGESSIGNP